MGALLDGYSSKKLEPVYCQLVSWCDRNMAAGANFQVRTVENCVLCDWLHLASSVPLMWPGGVMIRASIGLRLERLQVRLPAVPLSGYDLEQVVHTHVSLSPSSII